MLKKLILFLVISGIPSFAAWNPIHTLKNVEQKVTQGKYGFVVSVGAFGAAEGADYKTTVQNVTTGVGIEDNPVLTTNGVLNQNRLIGLKIFSFIEPVTVESYLYYKMNFPQKQKYGKWMIRANWVASFVIGSIAAHNREIYDKATQ